MAQRHDENYSEKPMTRMGRIQQPSRRYRRLRHPSFTAAIWTAKNPLLQRGEIGAESDTYRMKIGDGVTYWNDLSYVAASEIAFANITGSPDDNAALKDALDAKQDVLTAGSNIQIDSDNVISATDTTYTASDGVTLTGTNFTNSGVRAVASGTTNGTISVNTNGTSTDVAVTGLGSAAYTASSNYATSAQGTKADTAVQPGDLATVATTGAFSDLTGKPTTLSGYGITDGANTDLSNLTSTGKNIGNWSSNITNCITEIPQDIKLELNNGTLTLKSGSKLYVPNGVGAFDEITLTADKTATQTANDTRMYFYNGSYIEKFPIAQCFSGSSAPSGYTYMFWYDTANNIVKKTSDSGSTWESGWSLPFCIATASGGALTSIDQVFNGFGYIGSSRFFLPGVKVLIPNGRNTDGTLKTTLYTQNTVNVYTFAGVADVTVTLGSAIDNFYPYYQQIEKPNSSGLWYNPATNLLMRSTDDGATWTQRAAAVVGKITATTGGQITSFSTKTAFHAVDYSDTEYIAHQAMPSDRFVDLTLPADNTTLTAPADGYYTLNKAGNTGERIGFQNAAINTFAYASANGQFLSVFCPVGKGDGVLVRYTASGTTATFRFTYANGAK